MNGYLMLFLLLVVPLVVIAVVAVSVYGLEGPADDDLRAQRIFGIVGCFYGIYAPGLGWPFWLRPRRP